MKFLRRGIIHRTVISDTGGILGDGFAVRTEGLFKLIYREADHELQVGTEPLKGGAGRLVYLMGITSWAHPHDREGLSPEQVYKIRTNILAALSFSRIKFESNWLPSSGSKPIE
jgi:hypothetical protein